MAEISKLILPVRNSQTGTVTNQEFDIKESGKTIKTATLSAGSTSVIFTGLPTTGNNLINFYTSNGMNYTDIDTSTSGQVTLTFEAQTSAATVYCEIKEV